MAQPDELSNTPPEAAPATFPIVAVGASAGGLAPTVGLLRELGAEPGVAIVVIHHLDPTRESALVSILSRATTLPIAAASDGTRVEPNHVYVIPPNAELLIRRGLLMVGPRRDDGALHLPIDRFFESLALDQGCSAAGVVLSGNGYDGSQGIKAITREGGTTLAQDATAEHAAMPAHAISTGCIDFILPPAGLARELRQLSKHTRSVQAWPSEAQDRAYLEILAAVRRSAGVDFRSYKEATLRRRIQRRLPFHGLTDLRSYAELLQRDPAEARLLSEEMLVHVSGFFREPAVFDALRAHVFPKLLERRSSAGPIRVWVPGCSTGEEVYSIAICLLEFLEEARREIPFQIFGTDLSPAVIERARCARYSESIEGEVSRERLERFFSVSSSGYLLRRDVRDQCVFARQDVARDPPFSALDLVSCRNLLIYLGTELQDRVIALLHYALREPGFLVLGSAETVRAFPGFVPVDGTQHIYARTPAAPALAFDFTRPRPLPFDVPAPGSLDHDATKSSGPSDLQRDADRLVLKAFAPPGVVVTDELVIVQFRGQTAPFLEHTPGAASLDLLRLAREELRLPLRRAIDNVRATGRPADEWGIALGSGEERRNLALKVLPLTGRPGEQRFFLVLFDHSTAAKATLPAPPDPASSAGTGEETALLDRLAAAEQEIVSTRGYLEGVIERLEGSNEELKAANEEIVSSNEELQSTNEELQSAKEELQAANEELRSVNDEMFDRRLEAIRLSDDLTNVLTSVEIPILMVGRDLSLRRFTEPAARLFGLFSKDLGRLVPEIPSVLAIAPELGRLVPEVLAQLRPAEVTLQDGGGRWHQLTARPYVTVDGRIDGVVASVRDIDAERRGAERLAAALQYAENVINAVRHGLVVLDGNHRVQSLNKAFSITFALDGEAMVGRGLEESGCPALTTPGLEDFLHGVAEEAEGFELSWRDGSNTSHVFRLSACRIAETELLLVAFEDITQRRLAAEKIQAYQEQLHRMSFDAALTEHNERRRIAIESHDRVAQPLAMAVVKLNSAIGPLSGETRQAVEGAVELLEQAIVEQRELIFDLSPPILYDLGLEDAIAWFADELEKRHGTKIELLSAEGEAALDDVTKGVVFRAVRELLTNVIKHAQVRSAKVSLRRADGQLEVVVEDGGVGFDAEAPTQRTFDGGFGMLSLRAQVASLGGTLKIESAPRQGTRVTLQVPARAHDQRPDEHEVTP